MFIALNIDSPEDVIDVVEDIFESNDMVETDSGYELEPIDMNEPSYESVEIEIEEIEIAEIEIEVVEMEMELEMELEMEMETSTEEPAEEPVEAKEETETVSNEIESEPDQESVEEVKTEEKKEKTVEKTVQKKESSKEKAVKKIMKKISDKKRYDNISQTKTLVVMQVLGNTKNFFESQQVLNDRVDFFSNVRIPDTVISDNDMASYFLFIGSDGLMNDMIDSQWQN